MAIILLFTTLDNEPIEFPLMGKCTVGRSSSCDLTIDDKQMSGKHGMFEYTKDGQVIYKDMGSTNGSYVNNSQVHQFQFKIKESLRLGNTIVMLDEKRMTPKEKIAVGKGLADDEGKTLVIPKQTKSIVNPIKEESEELKKVAAKKSTIVLNKDLKKKTSAVPNKWTANANENVIEQEESSGTTKMLKLDVNKYKKK